MSGKQLALIRSDIATDKALFSSNGYPQHMFSCRNKKRNKWIPPLICSYDLIWVYTVCSGPFIQIFRVIMVVVIVMNSNVHLLTKTGRSNCANSMAVIHISKDISMSVLFIQPVNHCFCLDTAVHHRTLDKSIDN